MHNESRFRSNPRAFVSQLTRDIVVVFCFAQEEETEVDSHTMVKSGSEGAGTMRATSTMSDGAQTMIEHGSTMLESDLGTMVINSDEEEEEEDQGSMRSEWKMTHRRLVLFMGSELEMQLYESFTSWSLWPK